MNTKSTIENALVLRCYGADPADSGNCDIAVVEVSPAVIETIRQRQSICRQLYQNDQELHSVKYRDDSPIFLSVDGHDSESLADIVRNETFGQLHEADQMPIIIDQDRAERVQDCCMEIASDHVRWTGYPRRDAVKIFTDKFEIDRLIQEFEMDLRSDDFDRGR